MSQQTNAYDNLDTKQSKLKSLKFQRSKNLQPSQSMFFRNQHKNSEIEQSTQANNSRTKSRLKSTRVKSKEQACIYYELEVTKKNEVQILRQENLDLKQVIAELKLSQMYQIDESKVKQLLMEVEELRGELSKFQKQNEKLKLQNDFLNRTNFQLKLDNDRFRKKSQKLGLASHDFKLNNKEGEGKLEQNRNTRFQFYSNQGSLPEHLLLGDNVAEIRSSRQKLEMNLMKDRPDPYTIRAMKTSRQDISSLSRVRSEKLLDSLQSRSKRKISHKKTIYSEIKNDSFALQ